MHSPLPISKAKNNSYIDIYIYREIIKKVNFYFVSFYSRFIKQLTNSVWNGMQVNSLQIIVDGMKGKLNFHVGRDEWLPVDWFFINQSGGNLIIVADYVNIPPALDQSLSLALIRLSKAALLLIYGITFRLNLKEKKILKIIKKKKHCFVKKNRGKPLWVFPLKPIAFPLTY